MSALTTGDSHEQCMSAGKHICQEPSGRRCYAQPCEKPAGTRWGPYWCPEHDKERLDRISENLEQIAASLASQGSGEGDR